MWILGLKGLFKIQTKFDFSYLSMRGSKASFMNLRMVLFRDGSDVNSFSSEFSSGDCKKSRYFTKLLKCILSEPNHFIISQNLIK